MLSHPNTLGGKDAVFFGIGAVATFHLAFTWSRLNFLIAVCLFCLFHLTRLKTNRLAFYGGLAIGLALYAPQLSFFWTIFGPAALPLWLIVSVWMGFFLLLGRLVTTAFHPRWAVLLIPFLWTGLEYFRSELYYLRFPWLTASFALVDSPRLSWLMALGGYGLGFALMMLVAGISLLPAKAGTAAGMGLLLCLAWFTQPQADTGSTVQELAPPSRPAARTEANTLWVAGVQLEFPSELEVLDQLERLVRKSPEAQLLVLSEYTFDGPVPARVRAWCRKRQRYLIAGGKDLVSPNQFYNTVFVVGPQGGLVFRQAKGVPIQFFNDGLPAPTQCLWDSPWGKLGLCICYDLGYTRVTDRLIKLGAQALIVPTMDVADWGSHEHALHARVAPIRAAEYHVPVFRLASSGVSQLVDADGRVTALAPYPGPSAFIAGTLQLGRAGRVPWDRILAPISVAIVLVVVVGLMWRIRKLPC